MAKVAAVLGYGPGISSAVADLFASKGFKVGLVSRTQSKLDAAAAGLKSKYPEIEAAGFAANLASPQAVKEVVGKISETLGPVTVLLFNPPSQVWGPIESLDLNAVSEDLNLTVASFIAAVQGALPAFEGQEGTAILLTGGGYSLADQSADAAGAAVSVGAFVPAAGKAAQRNLVYTLATALKPKGVRVAEVVVTGVISGSEFAAGINNPGTIKPADVADKFWAQYSDPAGPVSVFI